MSDAKKADKITVEELHFLETLKKEFNMLNLKVDNTKLQYENALFKIMRKYDLKESDSIDETTGNIIRRTPPAPVAPPPPPPPPSVPALPPQGFETPEPAPAPAPEPEPAPAKAKKGKRDSK